MRLVKELPASFRLWVPARRATELETIRRSIINAIGGVTTTHSWGYWTDPDGNVVGEPVVVLEGLYQQPKHNAAGRAVEAGVELLLAAGEVEVLVEVSTPTKTHREVYAA